MTIAVVLFGRHGVERAVTFVADIAEIDGDIDAA